MNKQQIEEWIAHPNHALNRITIPEFKALCELALRNLRAGFSVPQGEPVAYVAGTYQSRHTLEWNGQDYPVGTPLYAAPPADEPVSDMDYGNNMDIRLAPPADGVVVPREPTGEMMAAGSYKGDIPMGPLRKAYAAMLAAAPKGGE